MFTRSHSLRKEYATKGFSLIEVLCALAISGILIGMVFKVFNTQEKTYEAQDEVVDMQQNLRAVLYLMSNELRMAGYNPAPDKGNQLGADKDLSDLGITAATATSITFTMVGDWDGNDDDGDGQTDEDDEIRTIGYSHYDAYGDNDKDIGRSINGALLPIAENIERVEFLYILDNGKTTTDPATSQLDNIARVQVSLLAKSARSLHHTGDTQTFTSASGANWTPATTDTYRRYFMTKTIYMRNLSLQSAP